MLTKLTILMGLFASQGPNELPPDPPVFEKHIYKYENFELPYRLLKPTGYSPEDTTSYPVLLFLHGAGERGTDNEVTLNHIQPLLVADSNRINYPAFVVIPQCPEVIKWVDTDWGAQKHTQPQNPSQPLAAVYNLLQNLEQTYSIDTNRRYVMGLSMGGFGTWDLITRYPDYFAAAIPICGGGDEQKAKRIRKLPIWVFHGAKDRVVLPERSRNMVTALKQEDAPFVIYTEYPNVAHGSWVPAFETPNLFKWLFSHKLPQK